MTCKQQTEGKASISLS